MILDPDYARIFTQARIVAWQYGYACVAHGSFTRDLDLLLVPWEERAEKIDAELVVKRIAGVAGLTVNGPPSDKPLGRKAWTLLLPGFDEVRWVDVSALAPPDRLEPMAANPEMSRESRAMLLNVLWHHQGGSSAVGQPLRAMLGIGRFDPLSDEQLSEAKWIDALLSKAAREPR